MKEINRRLLDLSTQRLEEMDAAGIDFSLLSLTSPGIQGELDPARAVTRAKQVNDVLAETVAAHPNRYGGFAALPLQDPSGSRCRTRALRERARVPRRHAERLHQHR